MVFWVSNMDVKTLEKIDLKMMHSNDLSNDLRELKKMIQEELNFRDDIGKEISRITKKSPKENQSYGQRKVNDS